MVTIEKFKAPAICPVCGGEYEITALTCKNCKSELVGRFEGCEFCQLTPNERMFLRAFLKCRGNIKEVEKELGISYPTVRSRLDALLMKLGLISGKVEPVKEERKRVLQQLEDGEISAEEAAEMLKSLK